MSQESDQVQQRRRKLAFLRERGTAFPNDFRRDALAGELQANYAEDRDGVKTAGIRVKVCGRLMSRRIMGKASFAHIQDMSGRIQLFLQRDSLAENVYNEEFKKYDIGDIVGVQGELFHTRTGELSVRVEQIRLLTKSLHPLPEKFHGLTDVELRYRQRYVDLIMNEQTRSLFADRSRIIQYIRDFMTDGRFLEVETPMMHRVEPGIVSSGRA